MINSLQLGQILTDNIRLKSNLSKREIEVLSVLCQGFTLKIVAKKLGVSVRTINHHMDHIKAKTNLYCKDDIIDFCNKSLKLI